MLSRSGGANTLSGVAEVLFFSLLGRLVGEIGCGRGQGWGRVRLGELPRAIAVSAASVVAWEVVTIVFGRNRAA